ncbi:hypothetical protein L7F22_040493 [Adiantum nelumboides]|nr:hypothetical protein [Adiantum nelumboides]
METLKQYYVAVDRQQLKMGTLVDLMKVLGRKQGLPLIMCCCSRDSLDAVCSQFSSSQHMSLSCLHSDLSEAERFSILERFQKAVAEWNRSLEAENTDLETQEAHSHLLVVTDACLPSQALAESPLSARLLINYDLPLKKEAYQRRLAACLGYPTVGSLGIVISMLVGGEVALLRNIEEGCGIVIEEMPIQIFELL